MGIKLNSILIIIIITINNGNILAQEQDFLNMDDFEINRISFKTSSSDKVIKRFGPPIKKVDVPYNPNVDWGDGSLQLIYNSIEFRYIVVNEEYIENITIKSPKYEVKTS